MKNPGVEKFGPLFLLASLVVLTSAACKTITDEGITADVKKAIGPVVKEGVLKIDLTTTSGVVSVRGVVQSERQKTRLMDLVKQVDGVKSIVDDLIVLPPPAEKPAQSSHS